MITAPLIVFLAMLSLILQKYLKLPSSIWLMSLGFLLMLFFPELSLFEVNQEQFSKTLLAFLPILLMADVMEIHISEFKKHAISIFLLAVVAVIMSVLLGMAISDWVFDGHNMGTGEIIFTYIACFATDPVAVVAIFSMFVLPSALKTLVEGESLINDGTAVTIAVYLALPLMVGDVLTVSGFSITAFAVILGSLLVGAIFAFLGFFLLMVKENPIWQLGSWLLVGLVSFGVAENFYLFINFIFHSHSHFHLSGIVAVISSIFIVKILLGKADDLLHKNISIQEKRIQNSTDLTSPERKNVMISVLEKNIIERANSENIKQNIQFLALMANTVLFIYLGELLLVNYDLMIKYSDVIIKMVLATLIIRGFLMGVIAFISNKSEKLVNIPFHWWVVLTFVGFQGGLSIVLSSLVPETTLNYDVIKAVILGNIVLSTFINAIVLIIYINIKKDLFIKEAEADLNNH